MRTLSSGLIVIEAESASGAKELLGKASSKETLQLFDPKSVFSIEHLMLAYENATIAFKNHTNRSRSKSTEMLLFASAQRQISEAIRLSGAKEGSRFILFTDSGKALKRIYPLLINKKPASEIEYGGISAMKRLGIEGSELADIAQAIAISGLQ